MTEIDEIIVELDRVYKMTTENKAWLRGRLENLARVNKRLADPVVDARNDPPERPLLASVACPVCGGSKEKCKCK